MKSQCWGKTKLREWFSCNWHGLPTSAAQGRWTARPAWTHTSRQVCEGDLLIKNALLDLDNVGLWKSTSGAKFKNWSLSHTARSSSKAFLCRDEPRWKWAPPRRCFSLIDIEVRASPLRLVVSPPPWTSSSPSPRASAAPPAASTPARGAPSPAERRSCSARMASPRRAGSSRLATKNPQQQRCVRGAR